MIELGVKTDPVEYRYSYNWLFDLLAEEGIKNIQLGSFFELYSIDDEYFYDLRQEAESRDLTIKSVFTAHRELGGFFTNNIHLVKVARKNYERLIHVASLLGADYCGSNPGAVYRDQMNYKDQGIECYLSHMKELTCMAKTKGLKALSIEPMSCLAEPPTTPDEMDHMLEQLDDHQKSNPDITTPVYLCADISHGFSDRNRKIIFNNIDLFVHCLPNMCEFHFKNTDVFFNRTFGFSDKESIYGIVDPYQIKDIVYSNASCIPVNDLVGYLEIGGPKLGRDYSDPLLRDMLSESINKLKIVFDR